MRALPRTLPSLVTGLLFPVCDLEGNEWEEHPQFCLTGEGNSVATKTQQPSAQLPEWHNTLVTNRVMDSGIHRISLLYTLPARKARPVGVAIHPKLEGPYVHV